MARSLSKVNFLATCAADGLSPFINRRSYAAVSQGAVSASDGKGGSRSDTVGTSERKAVIKEDAGDSRSWTPDPVTGYYTPTDRAAEIDSADLREAVLDHKVKPN